MEYSTAEKEGAINDKRHEATEESPCGIEGDLRQGQYVRNLGPREQLGQAGVGRGDAGDGTHGGRECRAD